MYLCNKQLDYELGRGRLLCRKMGEVEKLKLKLLLLLLVEVVVGGDVVSVRPESD